MRLATPIRRGIYDLVRVYVCLLLFLLAQKSKNNRLLPSSFEAWVRKQRPLRIMVGIDAWSNSDAALQFVRELTKFGPCDITAVHGEGWGRYEDRASLSQAIGNTENAAANISVNHRSELEGPRKETRHGD